MFVKCVLCRLCWLVLYTGGVLGGVDRVNNQLLYYLDRRYTVGALGQQQGREGRVQPFFGSRVRLVREEKNEVRSLLMNCSCFTMRLCHENLLRYDERKYSVVHEVSVGHFRKEQLDFNNTTATGGRIALYHRKTMSLFPGNDDVYLQSGCLGKNSL